MGDPADPPILLVVGIGASMLWWEEVFCRMLAENRRFVIRYDHRDTGRSVTSEPGWTEYTGADLVADAARALDAYVIPAAHVVGVSAGGTFALAALSLAAGWLVTSRLSVRDKARVARIERSPDQTAATPRMAAWSGSGPRPF